MSIPQTGQKSPHGELLVSLIATEIHAAAGAAQADGFFETVGRRLAALMVMDDVTDLATLESRANQLWDLLQWGTVRMAVLEDGVQIVHEGLHRGFDGDFHGYWPRVLHAVLRGTYDAWFRAIGSGNNLHTSIVKASEEEVEFYHGI